MKASRILGLPAGLAGRFALLAAGLAAGALLATALVSWWLVSLQHDRALRELAAREREFLAAEVGGKLQAIVDRMGEAAGSTILATGLVDSAGRETYLEPFLSGIRQINGVPVTVLFTDFEGNGIASNDGPRFTPAQLAWMRKQLEAGKASAAIFESGDARELVALEPLVYARTPSPEGGLLYKVMLGALHRDGDMRLEWGPVAADDPSSVTAVAVPAVFRPLGFRVRGDRPSVGAIAPAPGVYAAVALIIVLIFGAVLLAGGRIAARMTRELRRLEAFASRFGGGDLSTERAPVEGSAEVAGLALSINRMLDRLSEQHSVLVSEQRKLTELAQALRAADRRKDEFLAMLAHELRNPLAPILTGAEVLRRAGTQESLATTAQIITRQARHMAKIVDDLLDVSRVTRGLISLNRTEVDVASIVSAASDQIRPLVSARRQAFSADLPREPLIVSGDPVRLIQTLSNLLNNACKYTPEGGHIKLSVTSSLDHVEIAVQDDGSGIAPELLPEVFDLFTQGSRSADRSQGGLGLGLALVRNLVELHGGTVRAESAGLGRGAKFTVQLPRLQASAAVRPDAEVAPARGERALRALVVDDNVDAAGTLAALLALEGHSAEVAYDARSAIALAERHAFDLFILDIGLPGMDGIELAARVRRLSAAASGYFVALTGYGQAADRERTAAAGFDEHLVKPLELQALRELLQRLQARSGAAKRHAQAS